MSSEVPPRAAPRLWAGRAAAVATAGAAVLLAWGAAATSRTVLLKFGPHDADYIQAFRGEPEREGAGWFHWTSPASSVTLPVRVRGEGWTLRLRLRRHFIEPANVRLIVEGRTVLAFDLQADPQMAYRTVEVALPPLEGGGPFTLRIDAPSENPRPLGVALDWLALVRTGPGGSIRVSGALLGVVFLVALLAWGAPRWAGGSPGMCAAHAAAMAVLVAWALHADVLAAERILRLGGGPYVVGACAAALLAGHGRSRAALLIDRDRVAGGLVGLTLVGLTAHLVLLLHPEYFCPDAQIHAEFARLLARHAASTFLDQFIERQFQLSLGLQLVQGHWYALPYPPLFYGLCQPLIGLFHDRPDAAVAVVASAVHSLAALVVFALARRLGSSRLLALGAAAAYPLLPIFTVRLGLAYFPDVTGHLFDLLALLFLATSLREMGRVRSTLVLAGLLTLAFLAYTQSLLNFGLFLGLYGLFEVAADRSSRTWHRLAGLALAGFAAVALSFVLFYVRYVPGMVAMRRGAPQAEERVLIEKLKHQRKVDEPATDTLDKDPFFGPGFDLLRGVRKALWRGYVFYGAFAPLAVLGVIGLVRRSPGETGRVLAAWGLVYVIMNLGAGSLPSPNLFRYTKDMEFVAPLACFGLAAVGVWLTEHRRLWGALYAVAFFGFELWVYWGALPGRTSPAP